MEKRRAHYNLDEIKAVFSAPEKLRMSTTALLGMRALGFRAIDVVEVLQALRYRDLYKSMTSNRDHRIWQDVYHAEHRGKRLYIKFTVDSEGHFVISFKER